MKYSDESCLITENIAIANGIFDMTVQAPTLAATAESGQFCNLRCEGKTLRRPISICRIDRQRGTLRFVYQIKGEGTRWLSTLQAGDTLSVFGPLGHGFEVGDADETVLLVGGGIGTPPLLEAALQSGGRAEAILGFRSRDAVILAEDFRAACAQVTLCTDDGSCGMHGFVTDALRARIAQGPVGRILACGPTPMLRAVAGIAIDAGIPCQVSMEERMGCGIGACLVCACKVRLADRADYAQVCKDGPVFDARRVVWYEARPIEQEELQAVRDLRAEVLCAEQGYMPEEEFDDLDAEADFVLSRDGGTPVATGRLLMLPDGDCRIGRIAVKQAYRKRGAGRAVIEALLCLAQAKGARKAYVDAQVTAVGFYEKLGFCAFGEPHTDGHILHRSMELTL